MKLLAKHILFCSAFALVLSSAALASSLTNEEAEMFQAPLKQNHENIREMVDGFQKPDRDNPDTEQFRRITREYSELIQEYEKHYGPIDTVGNNKKEADPKKAQCANPVQVDYYFSFSMPESSISAAVADALALKKDCVDVTMRLRGFIDDDMMKTITSFYKIAKENPEDMPIEVDPVSFRKNNVVHAPTIVVGGKRYIGDMRLVGIIRSLDRLKEGPIGTSYPVKEEDLSEIFKRKGHILEEKVREYVASGAILNKFKLSRYDNRFSKVETRKVYYVDPTYTLPEDVLDHNGMVIFRKGTTYNPLDSINLGKYIFIDGNRPEDVELAIKGHYRKIIMVSGDSLELQKKHKETFYHANDEMIRLFRIERVPLIIEQEGRLIRATEEPAI